MPPMTYEVKTRVFEGPLDLLLQLITSHQVEITELSLSDLITEYLDYVDVMRDLELELTSEFLLIASTLIQIKARHLLPDDRALDLDDELAFAGERDRLLARLLINLTFKDVAAVLGHRIEANDRFVGRMVGLEDVTPPAPRLVLRVDPTGLATIADRVFGDAYDEPDTDHLAMELPSVQEAIVDLQARMAGAVETDFEDLVVHCTSSYEVVAYFLGLLELARWGDRPGVARRPIRADHCRVFRDGGRREIRLADARRGGAVSGVGAAIEAILFVAETPLSETDLAEVLEIPRDQVAAALAEMQEELASRDGGLVLRQVGGGWRLYTTPETKPYLERFAASEKATRLSNAALETLAVVAYKQPVSRGQVAEIRGVDSERALQTLQRRGLVEEIGHAPGPGQALLYGTTDLMLEKLGVNSIGELPPLADHVPPAEVVETLERPFRPEGSSNGFTS